MRQSIYRRRIGSFTSHTRHVASCPSKKNPTKNIYLFSYGSRIKVKYQENQFLFFSWCVVGSSKKNDHLFIIFQWFIFYYFSTIQVMSSSIFKKCLIEIWEECYYYSFHLFFEQKIIIFFIGLSLLHGSK